MPSFSERMDRQAGDEKTGELPLIQALIQGEEGAWAAFVRRFGGLIHSSCAFVFSGRELEEEYLNVLRRLQADDFAVLRAFDGRASLTTYLTLKLGDLLAGRILDLFDKDADRAWRAFERFFKKDIMRAVAKHFPLPFGQETLEDGSTHQDLYQEICYLLVDQGYGRIRQYDRRGSFTGYVRRIVRNLCIDLFRKMEGRRRLPEGIQRLPALEQKVFKLVYLEGWGEEELLYVLRDERGQACPPERVEQALARVKEALPSGKAGLDPQEGRRPRAASLTWTNGEGSGKEWEVPDFGSSPEEALIKAEEQRAREGVFATLQEAMAELPEDERLSLAYRYLDGERPEGIAKLMRRPVEEIYRILPRGKSRLATILKAKWGPEILETLLEIRQDVRLGKRGKAS